VRNRHQSKRTLSLDKENKKFLGVCAGVADYLEVEPWSVRLVFFVSVLFGGWFLIPIYFIAWFCLDDKAGEGISSLVDNQTLKHFRTVDYKKKLYRNTEDAKFLGVCAGVADYLEINVFAVRLGFMILVLFTAALPLFLYFGSYFILEKKPYTRMNREERGSRYSRRRHRRRRERSGSENTGQPVMAAVGASEYQEEPDAKIDKDGKDFSSRREFKYCARKFANLKHRLARMEAYVTSSQFRLHREFKNI
jgi:phage shock protein PspC (stress-responsive transcriptional regulator)